MSAMKIALVLSVALLALVSVAEAGVSFKSLNSSKTLTVQAKIQATNLTSGQAHVGTDHLVISWALNSSFDGTGKDASYVNVKIKLCYAPVSQTDRGWRKTKDDLEKDKTCSKGITQQKYVPTGNTTIWRITKDVPGAVYFVRVYAVDALGTQLAFGQTTDKTKTTNLIQIVPISGRHVSIDIAAAVFSVFSVGSLMGFLSLEAIKQRKANSKAIFSFFRAAFTDIIRGQSMLREIKII
ncbi:hypothetical protein R1sor_014333 [Riccia sorocarpa]|uniref:High-affinity nitrate transporter n=1 Tax=Riccia sorocarpa TaxID=122646 RepID=A0ABD3HF79_9MARC